MLQGRTVLRTIMENINVWLSGHLLHIPAWLDAFRLYHAANLNVWRPAPCFLLKVSNCLFSRSKSVWLNHWKDDKDNSSWNYTEKNWMGVLDNGWSVYLAYKISRDSNYCRTHIVVQVSRVPLRPFVIYTSVVYTFWDLSSMKPIWQIFHIIKIISVILIWDVSFSSVMWHFISDLSWVKNKQVVTNHLKKINTI